METKKKKPTIDEIIKGLDNLSYYHDEKGVHEFLRGAIGLIQDQKQEISFLEKDYRELHEEKRKLQKENERLTELAELRLRDNQYTCKLLLEKEKQVDELKAKQVIECHGMLKGCDMVKQAVKDTAKEIYLLLEYVPEDDRHYWRNAHNDYINKYRLKIKERYGVEVE